MAGAEGVDRLLRILIAWRPNAKRSVPAGAALCGKLATGNFSFRIDPLGFDSKIKIKKSISKDGLLAGAEGVEPSLMVLETTVKPFNYAPE